MIFDNSSFNRVFRTLPQQKSVPGLPLILHKLGPAGYVQSHPDSAGVTNQIKDWLDERWGKVGCRTTWLPQFLQSGESNQLVNFERIMYYAAIEEVDDVAG